MAQLSKAEQEAEATARRENSDPGEHTAGDVIDDVGTLDPAPAPAPRDAEPAPPPPPVKSKFDDKRADIISRFRTNRSEEVADQRDEISDFARSGMPPEFEQIAQPEPPPAPATEPEPEPEPAPAALPKTVKLKVFGQEKELSLDEVIAQAQIALAADGILETAKGRLREVDAMMADTRNRVGRTDPNGQHQPAPHSAQPAADALPDPDGEEHHDPMQRLIETMQYGDPAEAKELLGKTIQEGTAQAVQTALQQQRLKDEGARTAKVLKEFKDKNPELANDPLASVAIERKVYDLQIEDLNELGVDPAKLRQDGQPPTPGDIAMAHRWYRSEGFKVRAPGEMLETATSEFLKWKGTGSKPAEPQPAPRDAPRIDVTVDRTARRQQVPQQPNRTAAPVTTARQAQPAAPRDRSAIVQAEIARRNAPRGRVVG